MTDGLGYERVTINGRINMIYREGHGEVVEKILESVKEFAPFSIIYTISKLEQKTLDELEKADLLKELIGR